MSKKLLITLAVGLFLTAGTLTAIRFAKGYRFSLKEKKVTETGLLVANSFPTGASVYINDKLTTATNDTLNLPPGDYQVKIVKDGYIPWEKNLKIERELVTQTSTRLFPAVPSLNSLTYTGALNVTPSPDGEKIAFVVASASASPKNGLWVLNLTNKPLSFSKDSNQVSNHIPTFDLNQVKLVWSPDSSQVLAWNEKDSFLLDTNKLNDLTTQPDVTAKLSLILNDWEEQIRLKNKEKIIKLPEFFQEMATTSAKNIFFSPDGEKLMYTATASATIPKNLIPSLPASNNQPEQRMIEPGNIYVYDLKEDKNFFITKSDPNQDKKDKTAMEIRLENISNQYFPLNLQSVQWFPSSNHVIQIDQDKIIVMEYDGTNQDSVYAGPFKNNFTFPWPDGSKIIILTSLNTDSPLPPNLYTIDLK